LSFNIAVAGKGGVGKTTVAGLLVRYLVERGLTPVLAVDADSNTNLNEVLGLTVEFTLGDAREEMKKPSNQSPSMTKDMFIEMRVNQCLVVSTGFDLIAMGRPEGAGCYCAANHLLTDCMDKLAGNYRYLVIDNEAGMEHISRVTTQKVDLFLAISDTSRRGLTAARRVVELAQEMNILTGKHYLVVSMAPEPVPDALRQAVEEVGLPVAGYIPQDAELAAWDLAGRPISQLPAENPVVEAAFALFGRVVPEA